MLAQKILKTIGWILGGLIGFVLLYILAVTVLSLIAVDKKDDGMVEDVNIYILTNGDHTDIVVPLKNEVIDWGRSVPLKNTINNDTTAHFLAFGWGDKGFYLNTPTWAQLKFSVAFVAATGLGTAAMHTTFYQGVLPSEHCKRITVSKNEYAALVTYIKNSFQTDASGNFICIKTTAHYDNNDAFYEAKGHYSIFYTCNTWANSALKAAGQKACLWTPVDKGIFFQYQQTGPGRNE
jgi:uncharacterized protein (TIGR02117 family)